MTVCLLLTGLLALPSGYAASAPPLLEEDPGHEASTSVVAVIDTGVNPFHEAFRRADLMEPGTLPVDAVDSVTDKPPLYVPIDPISETQDQAWLEELLEPRTLYRFAGTNLLYYSMLNEVEEVDYHGHGTGTAGTVVANAPEVIIVMVQTDGHPLDEGVEWAANQPWIDVISISWGCPNDCLWPYAHTVVGTDATPLADDVATQTRRAWDAGKLVVNSAGNDGTTHWTDDDGAPWVIAVGGANASSRTTTFGPQQSPDLVSNYEVTVPDARDVTGYTRARGTSFSAPTVAATLAEGIRQARLAAGHTGGISNGNLIDAGGHSLDKHVVRSAMNRSAEYWAYTGPNVPGTEPPQASTHGPSTASPAPQESCHERCPEPGPPAALPSTRQPVNPVAPWLEMGWGYLNGTHAPSITAALIQDQWPPEKPLPARVHMDHRQQVRHELWPQPGPILDPEETEPLMEPIWETCQNHLQILGLLPPGSPCPAPGH